MITGTNESKTLTKHNHEKKNVDLMEENVIQINGGIMINVDVNVKSVMYVKKIMFGILLHVIVKMEKIQKVLWMIQGLRVMKLQNNTMKLCDKTEAIPKNFNENKTTCKMKKFYILLQFLSITIALLIAVSIYCCFTKYAAKRNIYYHFTSQITN